MSEIEKAISEIVNNKNEVSEFIDNPAVKTDDTETAKPPEKKGRGRPKKYKKHKKPSSAPSYVPEDLIAPDPAAVAGQPAPSPEEINVEALQRRNAAMGATMVVQTSGLMIAGEDGKMSKDEFSNITENFDRYFETKGISDFPPGIALSLALGGYYVRALTTEKSLPRVALAWAWMKSKISGWRKKKPKNENAEENHGA